MMRRKRRGERKGDGTDANRSIKLVSRSFLDACLFF